MARANRRRDVHVPLRSAATAGRVEQWAGAEWHVRAVSGTAAVRGYRCPGCDQVVTPGVPHVVAWPVGGLDERRHWHTACWAARDRRRPGRRR